MSLTARLLITVALVGVSVPAFAQIRPETSGKPSRYEPEIARHGHGRLVHPNAPHRHYGHYHRHYRR